MASQSWIHDRVGAANSLKTTLQWSHGLSAMDTDSAAVRKQYPPDLQWSHDLSAMDTGQRIIGHDYRGDLQWSHGLSAMDTTASSRPPPPSSSTFNGAIASQPWIHDDKSGKRRTPLVPSMEPWSFSHGYAEGEVGQVVEAAAPSMEPWPLSHGYRAAGPLPHGGVLILQWSHGLSAMDTVLVDGSLIVSTEPNGAMTSQPWIRNSTGDSQLGTSDLQWSHDLSAMDTLRTWGCSIRHCCSFNGAMAFQPWIRITIGIRSGLTTATFNGAMTFQPWIRRGRSGKCPRSYRPSMEP